MQGITFKVAGRMAHYAKPLYCRKVDSEVAVAGLPFRVKCLWILARIRGDLTEDWGCIAVCKGFKNLDKVIVVIKPYPWLRISLIMMVV